MKKLFLNFLELLFIGTAFVLLIWFLLAEPMEVTGDSMEPTLKDKEQLIAEKVSINLTSIKRGDIVIFTSPQTQRLLIKRIVGMPGEEVEIKNDAVYISGVYLNEPYLKKPTKTNGKAFIKESFKVVVPHNEYMILGDNRQNSTDSRDFGFIQKKEIYGKALFVYKPISNLKLLRIR